MWPNPQFSAYSVTFTAYLVTFTEKIHKGKLHFLCTLIISQTTSPMTLSLYIHGAYKKAVSTTLHFLNLNIINQDTFSCPLLFSIVLEKIWKTRVFFIFSRAIEKYQQHKISPLTKQRRSIISPLTN